MATTATADAVSTVRRAAGRPTQGRAATKEQERFAVKRILPRRQSPVDGEPEYETWWEGHPEATNYGNIQERVPETMTVHHRIGFEEAKALPNGDRTALICQPRPLNNTVPWAVHIESALGTSQLPSEVGARQFTRRPKGIDIWRGSSGYAGSVTGRKRSGVHGVEPHLKPGGGSGWVQPLGLFLTAFRVTSSTCILSASPPS